MGWGGGGRPLGGRTRRVLMGGETGWGLRRGGSLGCGVTVCIGMRLDQATR